MFSANDLGVIFRHCYVSSIALNEKLTKNDKDILQFWSKCCLKYQVSQPY